MSTNQKSSDEAIAQRDEHVSLAVASGERHLESEFDNVRGQVDSVSLDAAETARSIYMRVMAAMKEYLESDYTNGGFIIAVRCIEEKIGSILQSARGTLRDVVQACLGEFKQEETFQCRQYHFCD